MMEKIHSVVSGPGPDTKKKAIEEGKMSLSEKSHYSALLNLLMGDSSQYNNTLSPKKLSPLEQLIEYQAKRDQESQSLFSRWFPVIEASSVTASKPKQFLQLVKPALVPKRENRPLLKLGVKSQPSSYEIGRAGEQIIDGVLTGLGWNYSWNTKGPGSSDFVVYLPKRILLQVKTSQDPEKPADLTTYERRNMITKAIKLDMNAFVIKIILDKSLKNTLRYWIEQIR